MLQTPMPFNLSTSLPDDISQLVQDIQRIDKSEFKRLATRSIQDFDVIIELIESMSTLCKNSMKIDDNPPIVQLCLPFENLRFGDCEIALKLSIVISKIANVYMEDLRFDLKFPLPNDEVVSAHGRDDFFGANHYDIQQEVRNIFDNNNYIEIFPREFEFVLCEEKFAIPEFSIINPQPRVEMLLFYDFYGHLR